MPVFLPTSLQGADEIIESINELKNSDLQPVTEKLKEDQKEGTTVEFVTVVKKKNGFSVSACVT